MINQYPYTDFHELNLDYIMELARQTMGIHLAVNGNRLQLLNAVNEVISTVTVSYASKALTDVNDNPIDSYIMNAGTQDTRVIFTRGDGSKTAIVVPFATKAEYDLSGNAVQDYTYSVAVSGNKLKLTKGDGTYSEITVPFAISALNDSEGKDITTYTASIGTEGNDIVLYDGQNRELDRITVPYATKALQDTDGDNIKSTYGAGLITGTTTVKLMSKNSDTISEITVPYATSSGSATTAGTSDNATNAVQNVTISGDNMLFTTYGGQTFSIQAPYAVKAQKDDLGNNIQSTYVANVINDSTTGELVFLDAGGHEIVTLVPTVSRATNDSYSNLIADYVKTIVANTNSNYVTVTHGTGSTDSITINYSNTAWKDTNGNVIKNSYITELACVEDIQDGHYKLVAYDGDTPKAELFRIDLTVYNAQNANHAITADVATNATNAVTAQKAQTDINGRPLTSIPTDNSYVIECEMIDNTNTSFNVLGVKNQNGDLIPFDDLDISAPFVFNIQLYNTTGNIPTECYRVDYIYDCRTLTTGATPVSFYAHKFHSKTSGGIYYYDITQLYVVYVNDAWITGTISTHTVKCES